MTEQRREFGKRKPLPPPTTPPIKRSGHVALLLMGSLAVGGTAYALMSHRSCDPTDLALPQSNTNCTSRGSSSGGGSSSGAHFFGSSDSGRAGGTSGAESSGGVARGGFGASGHGFGGGGGE